MNSYGTPMTGDMTSGHVTGAPPSLGTPIPGTTGGLAAKPGLSVTQNPMAQALQSRGRGEDSMLVHMTPGEVGGLQNLAMAHGGSLTINPHTGLPEAGFLSKILPTLLGFGLSFIPGVGPLMAAGITGVGTTAITGDIRSGLMAGLGAFGGASLAGGLGVGEAAGAAAKGANIVPGGMASNIPSAAAKFANLPEGLGPGGAGLTGNAAGLGSNIGSSIGSTSGSLLNGSIGEAPSLFGASNIGANLNLASSIAPTGGAQVAAQAAKTGLPGILQKFGQTASSGFTPGSTLAKYAPYAAGLGLTNSVSAAMQPTMVMPEEQKSTYEGPYQAQPRKFMPHESGPNGEIVYFDNVNPYPGFLTKEGNIPKGYAEGGQAATTPAQPALADYVRMFQTSPGAITAPTAYPGGSPSELIRAAAKANGKEIDYGFQKGTGAGMPSVTPYTGGGGNGIGDISSILSALGSNRGTGTGGGGMSGVDLSAAYGNLISHPEAYSPPLNFASPLPGTRIDGVGVSGQGVMPDFKLSDLVVNPVDGSSGSSGSPVTMGNGQALQFGVYDTSGMSGGGYGILDNSTKDNSPQGVSLGLGTPTDVGLGLKGFDPLAEALGDAGGGGGGNRYSTPEDNSAVKKVAKGGTVNMKDGAFVVDARTVSELGNGSSSAGIDHLSRMGGRPVRGGGDGVSDSVPARIGGAQKARVARDEVIFSPEAVARIGGGDHNRGTQKLYALMEKAHKARKQAKRGQDTGMAKGLGALL